MIKNYPNSRLASSVQCDRCGRRVYTASDTVESIKAEFVRRGWSMGDRHICDDCLEAMKKEQTENPS